ncbi:MAG: ATP-dependent RNA helicase HrpA [Gammaproteobacteria bacterium]|nr:ATP-dependent RNA helicase HrpA [Gammaproteobacteria bacterium]
MQTDRHRLRKRIRGIERSQKSSTEKQRILAEIEASIQDSSARREQRENNLPRPDYPDLPVSQRREAIIEAIRDHQVVVIAGETGSGKTTQIPKLCLELGRGVSGLIGHTQPRRIAARSVASRIAEELNTELGHQVGFKVRFSDHVGEASYIKLMTDGILLAEIQQDRYLDQYDTIIIDEAHERSLNIDFLLGYLKQLLPRRPDLKLIITSATIDTERFAEHFENAPVINVSGRTYPVEMRYRPLEEQDGDLVAGILESVDELSRIDRGDILIFLSGEREIREVAEALRKHHPPGTEVLPLFSRLSVQDQNKIFQPHGQRRIVLATNVAETSLTVPGIKYVIDSGYARMSRYSYRSKVQRLPIEKVSQASANQRAGRCGRVSAGVCIRLYSEEDFLGRREFTEPEILRTNLASVILQMENLGLGDITDFPFVEPPDSRIISDGYKLLFELGAVDKQQRITRLGRQLVRKPIDPRLARMLFEAEQQGSLTEVLVIVSALSVQDPRERPMDAQQKADEAHQQFQQEDSDFLSLLNLWNTFETQRHHLSHNKLRKWCTKNYLSYLRLREWRDIHSQLMRQVKESGLSLNEQEAGYEAIHMALLSGLLGQIAVKGDEYDYLGARNIKLNIFPGSGLFKKRPKWIMAAELTETTRNYARTVAKLDPRWVETLAQHLLKRSYFDPHWEKKAAQVAAFEQTTLYGLIITAKRKVNFGPIDPGQSRELFIRGALVNGEYNSQAPFFRHNLDLISDVMELEHKSRRQDILVDEEVLYAFYDELIPQGIFSGAQFEKWRKQLEHDNPRALYLERDYLMRHSAGEITTHSYPDQFQLGALSLPLSYHFEPGHSEDGVTLTVSVALLNQLKPEPLGWLVPGMIEEKVTQLIKSLPKSLRRNFVPAPQFAAAALDAMEYRKGDLLDVLARQLHRIAGTPFDRAALDESELPEHLLMNIKVVDESGKQLAMGRDLIALQSQFSDQASDSFSVALPSSDLERSGLTDWDFTSLPGSVDITLQGQTVQGYPALVDEGETVAIQVLDTESSAQEAHRQGLVRLLSLQLKDKLKYLRKQSPVSQQDCMHYVEVDTCDQLREEFLESLLQYVCLKDGTEIRSEQQFSERLMQVRNTLLDEANTLGRLLHEVLLRYYELGLRLYQESSPAWEEAIADMQEQLDNLIYAGFLSETPHQWLRQYPRYLKAIEARFDRLQGNVERDAQKMKQVRRYFEDYLARFESGNADVHSLDEYRWYIEEYRVSLFAQELKTVVQVSDKRLQQMQSSL